MDARFATWLLTTCHVVIVLVAESAFPRQAGEDMEAMIQAVSLIQQRSTLRIGNRDPTTCTEAVMVEPRATHYTTVALNSASGTPGIDVITFVHGQDNAKFAKQLVKDNANLEKAYNQGMGEDEIYSQCPHLKQPPRELVDRFAIGNAMKMPTGVPLGVHKPWGGWAFRCRSH